MNIKHADIRSRSLAYAKSLGYPINADLPTLEVLSLRTLEAVRNRLLCLHAVLAVSYGLQRGVAATWLNRHQLDACLYPLERDLVLHGKGEVEEMRSQVNAFFFAGLGFFTR